MYTTLGIDIGKRAIRLAVCQLEGSRINFNQFVSIPIARTEDGEGLNAALSEASQWIAEHSKKVPFDASGMTVDPTLALSTHRLMPFNDPRMIDQVLLSQLADIWKVDETSQISYEIGEFVAPSVSKDSDGGEEEESENEGGYDVHVINYPRPELSELLSHLKLYNIDPHVVLPASNASMYAVDRVFNPPAGGWAILDIGESKSLLVVGIGHEIKQTRSFKLGSACIDSVLMEVFGGPQEDMRRLKEAMGFVAVPGMEMAVFEEAVYSSRVRAPEMEWQAPGWVSSSGVLWPVEPVVLSQACSQGLSVLMTGIRQTLVNFSAKNPSMNAFNFYLTGGGSSLCGLSNWLSQYLDVPCECQIPLSEQISEESVAQFSLESASIAVAAALNIDTKCALNLRHGALAHKGSLAYIQDNKWILASLIVAVIGMFIFMSTMQTKAIDEEHARLKSALEETSQAVFGKKILKYSRIEDEIASSEGYAFIPERTAFTHFAWISSQVNDNMADIEMDLKSLDIDTYRKVVSFGGEINGNEGLAQFLQLLEQYECFPNEIPEPKTSKTKDRTSFTLRVDANKCSTGGTSE